MAEEEDQVLELFDESVNAYKKALELDPGRCINIHRYTLVVLVLIHPSIAKLENEKLQEMLELLDGPTANDDDEDEEDS